MQLLRDKRNLALRRMTSYRTLCNLPVTADPPVSAEILIGIANKHVMKIKVVYTTFGSEKEALLVGEILIKERLAAGVNIHPIKSIFHWKDEVVRRTEYALFAQTESGICFNVVARLIELHSYEVPCIEVYTPTTTTPFGQWVHHETLKAQQILPEDED